MIKMIIGIPYSNWIGKTEIYLELENVDMTLHNAVEELLEIVPELKIKLKEKNMLENNLPRALFVADGIVVNFSDKIHNKVEIKMLYPICGG